jgi:hypothetical protein
MISYRRLRHLRSAPCEHRRRRCLSYRTGQCVKVWSTKARSSSDTHLTRRFLTEQCCVLEEEAKLVDRALVPGRVGVHGLAELGSRLQLESNAISLTTVERKTDGSLFGGGTPSSGCMLSCGGMLLGKSNSLWSWRLRLYRRMVVSIALR